METPCGLRTLLIAFLFAIVIVNPLFGSSNASRQDYVRHPPKGIVFTHHGGSASDPQQVHISLAGGQHMRISWITEDKKAPSTVDYGKSQGEYHNTATGVHSSYSYFFYTSGKIHHVRIGPLEPETTYYYRCGGFGPEFSFRTPPSRFPIEFAVGGDLGQTEWTSSTLVHMASADYDVFLLAGDLSYADSQQPLWDSFGRLVQPLSSARPWMVTEGNHEIEMFPIIYPHGFKSYNARWVMPHEESGSPSNLYYSFDVTGVHVIMLGSYADFDERSEQYDWLRNDLGKVDRRRTPWLVVVLHVPWYNTNEAHQGEGDAMRKAMEEVLYGARVDIVFAGHVHAYERFTRIYDNQKDGCGPIYITIGDGGNREGLAMRFKEQASPLSLFREPSFGHGRLTMVNGTHAHWSWHRNNDAETYVADEVWLESLSTETSSCLVQDPPPSATSSSSSSSSTASSSKDEL